MLRNHDDRWTFGYARPRASTKEYDELRLRDIRRARLSGEAAGLFNKENET